MENGEKFYAVYSRNDANHGRRNPLIEIFVRDRDIIEHNRAIFHSAGYRDPDLRILSRDDKNRVRRIRRMSCEPRGKSEACGAILWRSPIKTRRIRTLLFQQSSTLVPRWRIRRLEKEGTYQRPGPDTIAG